jgi:hypothetical protein
MIQAGHAHPDSLETVHQDNLSLGRHASRLRVLAQVP